MTAVATGFITLVIGLAGVAAMVLAVYLFSYAIDRLSCFESAIFTAEELEARRYASTVVIKAKLAGLLTNERDQVFRTFFERQSFPFRRDVAECGNDNHDDNETIVVDLEAQQEGDGERKDDPNDRNETEGDALEVVQPVKLEDDDAGGPSCSICLNIYEDDDKVIAGTGCGHMFHYDCCMQWMEKGNDDCPYCRKPMISPQQFYQAAMEVVGAERVGKLARINEEAAARVAALAAAGQVNIAHPVPPMGHRPVETPSMEEGAGHVEDAAPATAGPAESMASIEPPAPAQPIVARTDPIPVTGDDEIDTVPPKVEDDVLSIAPSSPTEPTSADDARLDGTNDADKLS